MATAHPPERPLSIRLGCVLLTVAMLIGSSLDRAQDRSQAARAKPKALIRRAVPGYPSLPQLTDQITRSNRELLEELNGHARDQLIKDQQRWVASRDGEYLNPGNTHNSYFDRLIRLQGSLAAPSVGPDPRVEDCAIVRDKRFKYGGFRADAHYPKLDGGGVSAAATNRYFLNMALSGISQTEATAAAIFDSPPPSPGDYGVAEYEYSQGFTLSRPGPTLITVGLWTSSYTGGAHAIATDAAYLINLRTGAFEPLDRIFDGNVDWRNQLATIVMADYDRKYGSSGVSYYRYRFEIMNVLSDPSNYVFGEGHLTILLNYSLPNLSFPIQVSYAQIRNLLRAGGPIAISAHDGQGR